MTLDDAAALAIAAINHIKMAKITTEAKVFEKVSEPDLQNYSQNSSKFSPE